MRTESVATVDFRLLRVFCVPARRFTESVRLTLDTTCLIDLEDRAPQATATRELVKLHRDASIRLFLPENYGQFQDRLTALGIHDLPSLVPMGRNEMSLWGAAVCGDDRDDLVERIHKIVHATVDTLFLNSRSRTVRSDAEGLAAHIRSGHHIFVTSDQHFLQATRRQALIALGAKNILTPEEALSRVLQEEAAEQQ